MKKNYSFLSDELAVKEIRKHKWIESEKQGNEIGFATAALDWIKKYGFAWSKFRENIRSSGALREKRLYRRFYDRFPVHLNVNEKNILSTTNDFNVIGFNCSVPIGLPAETDVSVTIRFNHREKKLPKSSFQFTSRIRRITSSGAEQDTGGFRAFLPFSEEVRDYLRACGEALS